jgi:hypothetical protein
MPEKQEEQRPFLGDLLRLLFTTQKSLDEAQKTIEELVKHGAMKPIEECNPQTIERFVSFLKEKDCRSPLTILSSVADSDFFFKSLQEIKESKEIYEIVFKDRPGKDIIFAFLESLEASDIQEDITAPLPTPSLPPPSQEGMSSLQVVRMLDRLDDIAEQVLSSLHTTRQELLEKLPALVAQELIKQETLQQKSKDMFLQEELQKRAALCGQTWEEYVGGLILLFGQKESLLDPEKDKELFLFFGILKAWVNKMS